MKSRHLAAAFLAIFTLLLLSVGFLQGCGTSGGDTIGTISGTVTEKTSGNPLAGVQITLNDTITVTTNENGFYEFTDLVVGVYQLRAVKTGFNAFSASVILSSATPVDVDFAMTTADVPQPTPQPGPGTATINGTVWDGTWRPLGIGGVTINVNGVETTTDEKGYYQVSIEFEKADAKLNASKIEYFDYNMTLTVFDGETVTHDFILPLRPESIVPFSSYATNFVTSSPVMTPQVYVRRQYIDTIEPISVKDDGTFLSSGTSCGSISANGRWVVFHSWVYENGFSRAVGDYQGVYIYDRINKTLEYITETSVGTPANGDSWVRPIRSISADGRYVVFVSNSDNLVNNDSNYYYDVYMLDRETGTIKRVSTAYDGGETDGESRYPVISANGRYIAYESDATNIVPGVFPSPSPSPTSSPVSIEEVRATNGVYSQIYVYDALTGETTLESKSDGGEFANYYCFRPDISPDGRYVVFQSNATNLTSLQGATQYIGYQIYLRNRTADTISVVSVNDSGDISNANCNYASVNHDGTKVSFRSYGTNLDLFVIESAQLFIHDTTSQTTRTISKSPLGDPGDFSSIASYFTINGAFLFFDSRASNLIAGEASAIARPLETNQLEVYQYNVETPGILRLSTGPGGSRGDNYSFLIDD